MGWGVNDYPEPPPEADRVPVCPVCGRECEKVYRVLGTTEIIGCDECVIEEDPDEVSECFPDNNDF